MKEKIFPLSPRMIEALSKLAIAKQVRVSYEIRSDRRHAWFPGALVSDVAPRTVEALEKRGIVEMIPRGHKLSDWRWTTYLLTDRGKRIIRTLKKAGQL